MQIYVKVYGYRLCRPNSKNNNSNYLLSTCVIDIERKRFRRYDIIALQAITVKYAPCARRTEGSETRGKKRPREY